MMLRVTKTDTIIESYFSGKDLTDLKIKIGDKKYSKEHLESMTSMESVKKGGKTNRRLRAILWTIAAAPIVIFYFSGAWVPEG